MIDRYRPNNIGYYKDALQMNTASLEPTQTSTLQPAPTDTATTTLPLGWLFTCLGEK